MESTVPSNVPTTIIPQNNPKNNNRNRFENIPRGFFYYFGFLAALASLLLTIVSITKDELTRVTFYASNANLYTEYCGWHNVHFDSSQTSYTSDTHQYAYSKFCPSNNHACKLTKSGRGWYGLIIISIVFSGIALIAFIFDFAHPMAYVMILVFDLLSFLCVLAAVLTWGIRDYCADACHSLNFPYSTITGATRCHSKFAVSWVLAVIAGGFSLLAIISLVTSRALENKRY